MSYNQQGQYQQQPPPLPRRPYQESYDDQHNRYGQSQDGQPQQGQLQQLQYQHDQNGYSGQQHQPQYPGQHTYDQYYSGGAVQQPRGGYPSPTQTYPIRQQSASYNPQDYAPARQHSQSQYQSQMYNPQHYTTTPTGNQFSGHYSPAVHQNASAFTSATSGPIDPYGYSDSSTAGAQYASPQQTYAQSPVQQQFIPQLPGRDYQQSPPVPQRSHGSVRQQSASSPRVENGPYPGATQQRSTQQYCSVPVQSPGHANVSPAPPEEWRPSPPAYPTTDPRHSPSPRYPSPSYGSLPSPPSSLGPTPPVHGSIRRSTTSDRHPERRPLPGRPESDVDFDYFDHSANGQPGLSHDEHERLAQEDLFAAVESAVLSAGQAGREDSPSISVSQAPFARPAQGAILMNPNSPSLHRATSAVNGHLSPGLAPEHLYSSDSDAEGTAGVSLMRQAEEEEIRRRSSGSQQRFSGYASQRNSRQQQHLHPHPEASDSDDYGLVDISAVGGGHPVQMTYGGGPDQLATKGELNGIDSYSQPVSSQHSSMRQSNASQTSLASRGEYGNYDQIHPFPPFNAAARVDAGGTGGLSEPTADGRRQSYDEGDEYVLKVEDRFPDEPPDIFYQPASTLYRPLPPPPEGVGPPRLQTDLRGQPPYPLGPDAVFVNQQGQWVPRSSSLVSHTTTPVVPQPLRSKTDAEERRLRQQYRSSTYSTYENTPAATTPAIDLPSLPGKRFVPSQLGAPAFRRCTEPWSLSTILSWLMQVTNPDQTTELKEADIKESLVALFTNKVPTMNIADAEGLSNRVVQDMYAAGTLVATEEWVKIVSGPMSGVIYQLTGTGCYAPTLHDHVLGGRCYSHLCQRTLKKVNLLAQTTRTSENWADFYGVRKEDIEGRDRKELELQNVLHEIVHTEDIFMEQLNILRTLYRDPLTIAEPSIITRKRKEKFLRDVFGRVDAVKQANEDHLLPQLKYRQQEQGPWVVGFSDIFRQWIRKAKTAYVDYAGGFPGATFMVQQEIDRNMDFRSFIDRARHDKRSNRLDWSTYLKAPITRLQRYTLLLNTVDKNMTSSSAEKTDLRLAIEEVKAVTMECNARVAEMERKVDLHDLSTKLALRPGMQSAVELNLDHFGRELIHRGDLQRMGGNRFTWLDSHAILFDHYLVLAKTVTQRAEQGGRFEKYDVSRLPIPMDLLILESTNDMAVQKRDYVKGITSVRDVTGRTNSSTDPTGLGRVMTNQSPAPNGLQHVNTGSSNNSLQTVTSLGDNRDQDRIMYPFKVKHLGRDTYTLFAPTEQARRDWCTKITEAKTKHAAALHNQNAEPFKLRVMADSAFVYDAFVGTGGKTVIIKGTPIDRAIKEVEQRFKDTGRPGPICRARVNCATSFSMPDPGKQMIAVGTDYGVYISEVDNPRGWTKSIQMQRVTQVAVLEEFNLFLLIADKSLIAYHLDVVCPTAVNGPGTTNDSARRAPQKLSGSKDVGFFVHGRMKDRALVFYKKRENLASVFKVLEPIYQKSTEKKRGMFKRGNTEFFREYDEFYIPAECGGINLFHSSLAVSTARGFEVLTLDKKQPWSVPELKAPHVQNIATHIKDQKALAMLRLSEQEFLLVYANCAVYVNKHGDVSRSVIMEFVGNAQSAALYGAYLILFDNDFVEIRNAQNGRLKQIIAGHEIKCLDDGGSWSGASPQQQANTNGSPSGPGGRTVKLVMQHPENEKTQIVVELLLNEKMKDG